MIVNTQTLKEIGPGEYEINVGQLPIGSGWRAWTFTLENPASVPVRYRLSAVNTQDEQWLVRVSVHCRALLPKAPPVLGV